MTTASKITLVRVAMIPAYLVTMYLSGGVAGLWMYISLGIFIVASLTDFIDGHIARKYHQVSDFGKFLDPIADKMLVMAALVLFVAWGQMPAWALLVILVREFGVSALRLIAVEGGTVIAAGWSGKVKTAVTMICLCGMLAFNGAFFKELLGARFVDCFNWFSVIAISVTTLYSGVEYFVKNKSALSK